MPPRSINDSAVAAPTLPAPTMPTFTPNVLRRRSYHCRTRSSVGAITSVLRMSFSIAMIATWLLPAPVGSTTTPRLRAFASAAIASV